MKPKIYVDGQEGTTGLKIHEHLAQRSDVETLRIDPDKRKDPAERQKLLNAADLVFLCLPDAEGVTHVIQLTTVLRNWKAVGRARLWSQ